MTVSGTPGTGTITLGSASSGYQSFANAYGANATVDILIVEGTAWEVARDCTYTNSGTTVTRGTLEASSTGSAVSFTSAAVVSVIATADRGRTWDAASLNTQVAGTDADTTMAVNTLYTVDMSAWATADRTYTLPATAAVGDRCGVMVTAGNASFELILTAGTGDTLNGIAGGTEWSRVFISNEVVIMRCVVANTTWVVEYDGRIPQLARMSLITTDIATSSAATWTKTNMNSSDFSRGAVIDVATNDTITWRRASYILISGSWQARSAATLTDNEQCGWAASYGGAPGVGTLLFSQAQNHPGTTGRPIVTAGLSNSLVPAGSAIQHNFYASTTVNAGARALTDSTFLSLLEVFS